MQLQRLYWLIRWRHLIIDQLTVADIVNKLSTFHMTKYSLLCLREQTIAPCQGTVEFNLPSISAFPNIYNRTHIILSCVLKCVTWSLHAEVFLIPQRDIFQIMSPLYFIINKIWSMGLQISLPLSAPITCKFLSPKPHLYSSSWVPDPRTAIVPCWNGKHRLHSVVAVI
jgi:hypothetical protein